MKRVPYLLLSLAIILLDAWTKWQVSAHIDMHDSISLIPNLFQLVHVRNTGAAFGIGLLFLDMRKKPEERTNASVPA